MIPVQVLWNDWPCANGTISPRRHRLRSGSHDVQSSYEPVVGVPHVCHGYGRRVYVRRHGTQQVHGDGQRLNVLLELLWYAISPYTDVTRADLLRLVDNPTFALFQRDRGDAPDPMSMLFYNPQVSGEFWDGLALDHYFPSSNDSWVSMRSTWTNTNGNYVAMKSGALTGHQTHGDLDTGT